MESKRVKRTSTPGYPTRREVLAGAATFALASVAGKWCLCAAAESGTTVVAPIFEHGEGRGAIGCVVVSPPVFLSEEEAVQIIREELGKHGIQLKGGVILKDVRIPQRMRRHEEAGKGNGDKQAKETLIEIGEEPWRDLSGEFGKELREVRERMSPKPLRLSGVDSEKRVMVEFVAEQNYFSLGGAMSGSTVQDYDFRDVAKYVATKVKEQAKEPIYLGVFYDPLETPDRDAIYERSQREKTDFGKAVKEAKEAKEESKVDSKKLLRQQAQDFVAWLKERKAIP
jgi:hypothetical protein